MAGTPNIGFWTVGIWPTGYWPDVSGSYWPPEGGGTVVPLIARVDSVKQCDFTYSLFSGGGTLGKHHEACYREATHVCRLTGTRLCHAHADSYSSLLNEGGNDAIVLLLQKYADIAAALLEVGVNVATDDTNPADYIADPEATDLQSIMDENETGQPKNTTGFV